MDLPPPLLVAAHWPYVRRHLELSHHRPERIALDTLAELQCEAGGEPASLGRQRLLSLGRVKTPGEATAVLDALADLRVRRVLIRRPGAGPHPAAWSFRADISHWRGMAWTSSGRDVEAAVLSCKCVVFCATASESPAQALALASSIHLSADDHLRRPGLLLVDSRRIGATDDAVAQRPGKTPVDSRRKYRGPAPLVLSSGDLLRDLSLNDRERERFEQLRHGVGGQIWGRLLADLAELARRPYSPTQLEAALQELDRYRLPSGARPQAPMRVARLAELLESPAIRALGADGA